MKTVTTSKTVQMITSQLHLFTLFLPHLVILHHLLKGLHPVLFKHAPLFLGLVGCRALTYSRPSWMQALTPGLVGCRGLTPGLVVHRGFGLLFTSLQAATCSPVPPLASDVGHPDVGSLFLLCFVQGNISRCNGSKGRIAHGQVLPLPDDLVVHRRENVLFLNPNTRVYQQSREVCNVYYHPRKISHFRKLYSSRAHQDRPCGSKQIC